MVSSDDSHLRKWVKEFAALARTSEILTEDLLQSPCQITAIFINEEKLIILLFRHDQAKADMEIVASSVQSWEESRHFLESKVLADAYYLEKGYAVELAGSLGEILSKSRFPRGREPSLVELGYFKDHKINEGYVLIADVDVYRDTPKSFIRSEKPHARKTSVKGVPSDAREVNYFASTVNYFASFWYPPILFKDAPITLGKAPVFQIEYKGHNVIFDDKSFLSVLVPTKPPFGQFANKAVELMNEIIASANILGLPGIAATVEDLVTFYYREDSEYPVGVGHRKQPTVRSLLFEDFMSDPARVYKFDKSLPFRVIDKSLMEDIIRKAEKITENKEVKNYLLLLLDATTHMLTGANKAAFLHGWIVIEKYIDDVWAKNLLQQGITGTRHKKLCESILWTTDDKLEMLNLLGVIPNERYVEMVRLKKIRNDVVHKERAVHSREAQECLRLCRTIVSELVRSRCYVEV